MTDRLRIGSRASPLALAQTALVTAALTAQWPDLACEVVRVRTAGDRTRRTVSTLDFTDEIDRKLAAGEIDLAVHSTKDLPAEPERPVVVAGYLPRDDPRDCVVLRSGLRFSALPNGARLGSSSVRRRAQLLSARPDLVVVPVRGNVGTRIDRIAADGLDGVVLAAAGLHRLGWRDRITDYLSPPRWLSAPGQGAIAIEVRADDRATARAVAAVDHRATRHAVDEERAVVRALGGDCDLPLGALARAHGSRVTLVASLWSEDGRVRLTASGRGVADGRGRVGDRVGRRLAELHGTGGRGRPRRTSRR